LCGKWLMWSVFEWIQVAVGDIVSGCCSVNVVHGVDATVLVLNVGDGDPCLG